MPILLILLATILIPIGGCGPEFADSSISSQTTAPGAAATAGANVPTTLPIAVTGRSPVCDALKKYPKAAGEKMAYEIGDVSPICKPFVKYQRRELDRCGDQSSDPYVNSQTSSKATEAVNALTQSENHSVGEGDSYAFNHIDAHSSHSHASESGFTWATRNELAKKGKGNIYTDPDLQPQLPRLLSRIEEFRQSATRLCCGGDESCQKAMNKVEVTVCKPTADPDAPDPCVFGGSYRMAGDGYSSIFRAVHRTYASDEGKEFRNVAEKNLTSADLDSGVSLPSGPVSGSIVLSSYVSKSTGVRSLEPVIAHEFGHACSMIHMQNASIAGKSKVGMTRALRAVHWLDRARARCQNDVELPEAYDDFWENIGESRELAQCLRNLTVANQKQLVDRPCNGLCPGHYMEESVGIAFSLLLGEVNGGIGAVFPNTCDHVRDGQHPMVSDIADCLAQHSPRFRDRLRTAYNCPKGN